jgi:transcriptional regulator with XRE-family HTH domain
MKTNSTGAGTGQAGDGGGKRHPVCRTLGAVLRRRRLEAQLSQYEVAACAGIARQTVENIEGNYCAVSVDVVARLCEALGVAVWVVFREAEEPGWRAEGPGAEGSGNVQ